jgi:hypothetical protein
LESISGKLRRQFRFSAGLYFFLGAVGLVMLGRFLPWPLVYLRKLLLPYFAVTTLLMRLTHYDALDKAARELGPNGLVVLPFAAGPFLALYFMASLIIVSFVLGALAPIVVKGIQWIRERRRQSKARTNATEPQLPLNSVRSNCRVPLYFAIPLAMAMFAACLVVSFHAGPTLAAVGRSKVPPVTTTGVLTSAFSSVWRTAVDVIASAILATAVGLVIYKFTRFLLRITSPREQLD